jgi:hypothetical protein
MTAILRSFLTILICVAVPTGVRALGFDGRLGNVLSIFQGGWNADLYGEASVPHGAVRWFSIEDTRDQQKLIFIREPWNRKCENRVVFYTGVAFNEIFSFGKGYNIPQFFRAQDRLEFLTTQTLQHAEAPWQRIFFEAQILNQISARRFSQCAETCEDVSFREYIDGRTLANIGDIVDYREVYVTRIEPKSFDRYRVNSNPRSLFSAHFIQLTLHDSLLPMHSSILKQSSEEKESGEKPNYSIPPYQISLKIIVGWLSIIAAIIASCAGCICFASSSNGWRGWIAMLSGLATSAFLVSQFGPLVGLF